MNYFDISVRSLACGLLSAFVFSASAQDNSWQAALGDSRELATELREEIVSIAQLQSNSGNKLPALVGTLYQPLGLGPFAVVVLSHGSPSRATILRVLDLAKSHAMKRRALRARKILAQRWPLFTRARASTQKTSSSWGNLQAVLRQ